MLLLLLLPQLLLRLPPHCAVRAVRLLSQERTEATHFGPLEMALLFKNTLSTTSITHNGPTAGSLALCATNLALNETTSAPRT
jgi:hypothetical protein